MSLKDYSFPNDRKYLINKTPSHLWLQESENNAIKIGLTDFFQQRIGKLVSLTLKAQSIGDTCQQGKTLGLVKAKNYSAVLKYPLSGKISAINEKIVKKPNKVNSKPYDEWLLEIRPHPDYDSQQTDSIVSSGEELKSFIKHELTNNALQADDCCPDFLGGSGVVRRKRSKK